MKNTPVKLISACKDYIWGGDRLIKEYGKTLESGRIAESWELSAHPDGESIIGSGAHRGMTLSEYISHAGRDSLGENSKKYDYFPLLIKLIDARSDLSVQVHPSDDYALSKEGQYGKTEMWYIIDCEEGSEIYYGFDRDVTRKEYESAIADGTLCDILRRVKVKAGDCFFIPSGTVHAIGAGILICEVQQNSNLTYRVYDYNRRDKDGNTRPLHIEKALEVSTLSPAPRSDRGGDPSLLADCSYFRAKKLSVNGESKLLSDTSSFVSLIVTKGNGCLDYNNGSLYFQRGDSIFIPAANAEYILKGNCEIIESRVN